MIQVSLKFLWAKKTLVRGVCVCVCVCVGVRWAGDLSFKSFFGVRLSSVSLNPKPCWNRQLGYRLRVEASDFRVVEFASRA